MKQQLERCVRAAWGGTMETDTTTRGTVSSGADQSVSINDSAAAWPRRKYAWYVVSVLTAAYTLSYIDRSVLGLLLEPIRRQFSLTDTQVSLLAGTAFVLFYVAMGLPLGRLADRANRRNLIVAGVFFWSLMTTACGLAGNFWQLFAARVGVGVGEATLAPAALSIISDYFPPDRRARPIATYTMAVAIGAGLAYIAGGAVSAAVASMPGLHLPIVGSVDAWQVTFMAVGLPGIIFTPIILTIREPLRRGVRWSTSTLASQAKLPVAPVREVLNFMRRENPQTFLVLFLAHGGFAMHSTCLIVWMPTVFVRRFGWSAGQIGLAMGLVILVFASLGILASIAIASRLQARGSTDALMRTSLLMGLALTPLGIFLPLASSPAIALVVMAPYMALSFGLFAMSLPILQLITPNQMRGQVSATFAFFNNVIGLMLGVTFVALLTDYVFHDRARLHHSLLIMGAVVLPLCTLLFWWGLPHYRRSLVVASSWIGAAEARVRESV